MGSNVRTLTIDRDLLEWALERVGGDDCPFEPLHAGDPDHHGPEFAAALFEALTYEVDELDALTARALSETRWGRAMLKDEAAQ